MNGDTHRICWDTGRLLLCAASALTLGACVSVPVVEPYAGAQVDPGSAAAAQVQAAAAKRRAYPTFEGIPEMPTDIRPPEAFRVAVAATEDDRSQLLRETAPGTFSLSGTEAFAADQRARVDIGISDIPTAADAAATEAWARAMRARATPPPRPR
jgi:hypothetical protein